MDIDHILSLQAHSRRLRPRSVSAPPVPRLLSMVNANLFDLRGGLLCSLGPERHDMISSAMLYDGGVHRMDTIRLRTARQYSREQLRFIVLMPLIKLLRKKCEELVRQKRTCDRRLRIINEQQSQITSLLMSRTAHEAIIKAQQIDLRQRYDQVLEEAYRTQVMIDTSASPRQHRGRELRRLDDLVNNLRDDHEEMLDIVREFRYDTAFIASEDEFEWPSAVSSCSSQGHNTPTTARVSRKSDPLDDLGTHLRLLRLRQSGFL